MKRLAGLVAALLLAACAGPPPDEAERFPTSGDFPPGTMERVAFTAGVPEAWRLSTLRTPARPDAPWRILIVTGTPSWTEFWAPTIARAPENREMIVVERPGFSQSEPEGAVPDIAKQADAMAPLLEGHPGQRIVIIGQSFGSPVSVLMAAAHPDQVQALVLLSPYFGEQGPTARRLFGVGRIARPVLPRDFKNSVTEVAAQGPQLPRVWEALRELTIPIVFIHGERDTFVPVASSRRIAAEHGRDFIETPGGDHFLNACCVEAVLAAVEQAIAEADARDD